MSIIFYNTEKTVIKQSPNGEASIRAKNHIRETFISHKPSEVSDRKHK